MATELLALKIIAVSTLIIGSVLLIVLRTFPIMIIFGLILILSGLYVSYFSQYSFKVVIENTD